MRARIVKMVGFPILSAVIFVSGMKFQENKDMEKEFKIILRDAGYIKELDDLGNKTASKWLEVMDNRDVYDSELRNQVTGLRDELLSKKLQIESLKHER